MLRKKILNIKQNSQKISLPLIIPSLSNKFQKVNNKNNSMNLLIQKPKTIDARKITIRKININKSLLADIDVVKNLDIDTIPNMLLARQFEMKKLKENIDNNTDIELKRLGKYKPKQTKQSNQSPEEKDIESKERVRLLEKKYLDDLEQYKNIKSEREKLNAHILNIINIIDDYKLELYSFDNYSNDLYKKFKENIDKKRLELLKKMEDMEYQGMDQYNLFDNELNKLTGDKLHFQEEIKQKRAVINENITKAQELLNKLQEKKNNINDTTKELKNKIKENKINLIKLYHLSLYEGLDFRYEGLSNIIRSIWNLGVEVDVTYMPKYLDKLLINFLFEHAKMVIQINNFKKQLDISNKKFLNDLDDWKKINNISLRYDEASQRSSNNISDVDLFQTKLNKSKIGNKRNSKSVEFMQNYYNKFYYLIDNKEKNELSDYKQSRVERNFSIPKKFTEEHNDIEKGKIILQNLQNKMKNMEKNEIKRICREFTYNNYGIIYNVCPYIIVSAICGNEYKDEGMIFYNVTEREISDNKKKLRFHDVNI